MSTGIKSRFGREAGVAGVRLAVISGLVLDESFQDVILHVSNRLRACVPNPATGSPSISKFAGVLCFLGGELIHSVSTKPYSEHTNHRNSSSGRPIHGIATAC